MKMMIVREEWYDADGKGVIIGLLRTEENSRKVVDGYGNIGE